MLLFIIVWCMIGFLVVGFLRIESIENEHVWLCRVLFWPVTVIWFIGQALKGARLKRQRRSRVRVYLKADVTAFQRDLLIACARADELAARHALGMGDYRV